MDFSDIILDEKQREIFVLKQQGLTYKKIAEKVGLSASTVSLYYKRAERIVTLTEWYQHKNAEFDEPSGVTLTKGDVRVMLDALLLLERTLLRRREPTPVNKYQQEYLQLKKESLENLIKMALICTLGEKKYEIMAAIHKQKSPR